MRKNTFLQLILIPVILLQLTFVANAPARTVHADNPQPETQMDAFGNVVFDGEFAYNYARTESGVFVQKMLDGDSNVIAEQSLLVDPFQGVEEALEVVGEEVPFLPSTSDAYLSEEWTYPAFGSGLGASGLTIVDLDADGTLEIVAADNEVGNFGANNRWFVLRKSDTGGYENIHLSETYPASIKQIVTGDVDKNQIHEIYVGLENRNVLVYSGDDFHLIGTFTASIVPVSLVVEDANNDHVAELVLSNGTAIVYYDAIKRIPIWEISGYGGDLAVGNVDNQYGNEVITSSGYVLDGTTLNVKWSFPGSTGYNARVAVGDLDGNGILEIVAATGSKKISVFDAVLQTTAWEISVNNVVDALTLSDINGDGFVDIVYGDDQWGSVRGVDGLTHQQIWSIRNPDHGVTEIAIGDTDEDGRAETFWGAGYSSTGADHLYAVGVLSSLIEWKSIDMDGPLYAVDTGDVDDDGQTEILMFSGSSNSGYNAGLFNIFDAQTHHLEYQTGNLPGIIDTTGYEILRVADVEQDGMTEFVIATSYASEGIIHIYNGTTRALERQSPNMGNAVALAMEIGDVDGDLKNEIVVLHAGNGSVSGNFISVFNGTTATLEWQSPSLDNTSTWPRVYDIHLADVDQDSHVEIIAALNSTVVYVFDGVTHAQDALITTPANVVSAADLNGDGVPSILVGRKNGTVEAYNGITHTLEESHSFSLYPISCLKALDLDLNGTLEWLVCNEGRLRVYALSSYELLSESPVIGTGIELGGNNQIPVGQIDDDPYVEIVVGSSYALYQFDRRNINPLRFSQMSVSPHVARPKERLTYTIELSNVGSNNYLSASAYNPLPAEISYVPNSLSASGGSAIYGSGVITWTGSLNAGQTVTLTYQALVNEDLFPPASIENSAQLSAGSFSFTISAKALVGLPVFLPMCMRSTDPICGDYVDTFDNRNSGWPVSDDNYAQFSYLNAEYRILAKDTQYMYLAKAPTCERVNYSVEMDARWNTTTGYAYGLLFGLADDFSEYYMFAVNSDNQAYSLYYRGPNGIQTLLDWSYSSMIHPAAPNKLKVTRAGSEIILEINGAWVNSYTDTHITGFTKVGLFNIPYSDLPNADARYDNFTVRLLPGTTTQPEAVMNQSTAGLSWVRQTIDFERLEGASLPTGE